jgi:hypothetical protein
LPQTTLKVVGEGRKEDLDMVVYEVYVRREHDKGEFLGAFCPKSERTVNG